MWQGTGPHLSEERIDGSTCSKCLRNAEAVWWKVVTGKLMASQFAIKTQFSLLFHYFVSLLRNHLHQNHCDGCSCTFLSYSSDSLKVGFTLLTYITLGGASLLMFPSKYCVSMVSVISGQKMCRRGHHQFLLVNIFHPPTVSWPVCPLWLKYLCNYWMDCVDILDTHGPQRMNSPNVWVGKVK